MKIREFEQRDFDGAELLLSEFQRESLSQFGFSFSAEHVRGLMAEHLGSSFVVEDGGKIVGGLALKIYVAQISGEKIAQEVMWFVLPKYRSWGVRLLRFAESWCKEKGVKKLVMVRMGNEMGEKIDLLYRRMGYSLLEVHYVRDFGG